MLIVCISASNIKHAGDNSTSLKVCKLIEEIAYKETSGIAEVKIIPLVNYELKPCIGCGKCFEHNECVNDTDFNNIYNVLCSADALFIISAHYAPIPSKLSMLLEKIEQLAFLKRFNNENYRSPLFGKPVGIIGHGGGTSEMHELYKAPVVDSIWNALSYPVEMKIIGVDSDHPRGITFPVKEVMKHDKSVFPVQKYDWDDISMRLAPLVHNVVKEMPIQGVN